MEDDIRPIEVTMPGNKIDLEAFLRMLPRSIPHSGEIGPVQDDGSVIVTFSGLTRGQLVKAFTDGGYSVTNPIHE